MNLRIFSSRSTTSDRVGVCTRPTVVRKNPPSRELNAVMARVPLMPTSQSASERLRAALASPAICCSVRRASKPSRMAWGVMDCSHRRLTGLPRGLVPPAYCSIRRKISSPSRPASQALMSCVTSLRLACLTTAFRRLDLYQVAHGAGDYIAVVLEVVFVLVELAGHGGQCAHDVLRDRGFFCNYQGLGHFGALASHSGCPGSGRFYNSGLTRMHTHTRARTHVCTIKLTEFLPCPAPHRLPPPPLHRAAASRPGALASMARACLPCRILRKAKSLWSTRAK